MSITPGSINKLSPFGNGISKSLLTPCRRVGLSRNKKTPNSVTKLLSNNLNNSNSNISEQTSSDITPVSKQSSLKRKSGVLFDSSVEKISKVKEVAKQEKNAKKSLTKCFKNDEKVNFKETYENTVKSDAKTPNNEAQCIESNFDKHKIIENKTVVNEDITSLSKTFHEEHIKNTFNNSNIDNDTTNNFRGFNENQKSNLVDQNDLSIQLITGNIVENDIVDSSKENIPVQNLTKHPNEDDCNSVSSTNSSPVVKKPIRRILSDSDDDDDFNITKHIKTTLKTYERKKLVERNQSTTEISDHLKDCKISIRKLSDEDIHILGGHQKPRINVIMSSDEEDVHNMKKKKNTMISDDEDNIFQDANTRKVIQIKKEKPTKPKKTSKTEKNKIHKVSSLVAASTFEEDDDAFTSTPDRERNEKLELIDKIKELEKTIHNKQLKLDNLKRASLYKSKHNIEDLSQITEIWRQGCLSGLNGLLVQLQGHGSQMDMTTLLSNLKIPDEVVSKLFKIV